jgi:RNA polymerase sigma factor (sigma-70 family)
MRWEPAPSDVELWRRSRTDPEAFGTLFERHVHAVYAFCCWRTGDSALAEDLTSVVFLEAWTHRRSITICGTSVRPWLLGVANNLSRNAIRGLVRHRAALARIPRVPDETFAEEDIVARLDAEVRLHEANKVLQGLSDAEREITLLVFWSGLSYEEAGEALRVPVGTIRSRVSRTRSRLRKMLLPVTAPEAYDP